MSLGAPLRTPTRIPLTFLAPCLSRHGLRTTCSSQALPPSQRQAHTSSKTTAASMKRLIPLPTPFCPDASTFLSLIGRNMSQHASKFSDWDTLFRTTSGQLKEMGIEPPRSRRYLLWWRDQFRRGRYGIGGDMTYMAEGIGEVRVRVEPDGSRVAVNVPVGSEKPEDLRKGVVVQGLKVSGPGKGIIHGSYFTPIAGSGASAAQIKAAEGVWEVRRGRKVHGGERRRKNVLSRIAARARGTLT